MPSACPSRSPSPNERLAPTRPEVYPHLFGLSGKLRGAADRMLTCPVFDDASIGRRFRFCQDAPLCKDTRIEGDSGDCALTIQ